jgi:macrodomain Ter protein organizer (MatP/YcbG family)
MSTEWIRKHVKPSLVAKYDQEMSKLRGEHSSSEHIVENIKKLNKESEKIETDEERHARELAEDLEEDQRFQEQRKREREKK